MIFKHIGHAFNTLDQSIRIYHECEDGIEKSILRITIWHQKAWRAMTNADHEGQIFLTHPHTNNEHFFLFTVKIKKGLTVVLNP